MRNFELSNSETNGVSAQTFHDNLVVGVHHIEPNGTRLNGQQEATSCSDLDMKAAGPPQGEADRGNPLWALLSSVAADVLQIEPHELEHSRSFLALGGDSLSAIDFMARCREHDIHVDIADILIADNVSQLIDGIIEKQSEGSDVEVEDQDFKYQPDQDASEPAINNSEVLSELQARSAMPFGTIRCISPCSPMQENFLISQKLDPEAYQCRFVVKITSSNSASLTTETLAGSWAKVVARHTALRTSFLESELRPGKFDQVVWDSVTPQVTCYQDASAIFETSALHRSNHLGVPHSLMLAQVSTTEVYLRLDISHALVDGQSTEVFLADFCRAHQAETPLGDVLAYTDFVEFQRRLPTDKATKYWSRYLDGANESFLPVKVNQAELSGLCAIQERLSFRAGLLDDFCGQHNVTVANICQVAWGLVLRSFTNSEKTCFSYVTSGRQSELRGIQDAVGLFANTLICRLDFDASAKVTDVLKVAHGDFVRSIPHQHAVFTGSKDARHQSPRQWGNSMLSFHRPLPTHEYAQSGLEFQPVTRSTPTDYDVSLNIDISRDSIELNMDFWESKMDNEDANRILRVYEKAIRFVLNNAGEAVECFSPLTTEDMEQLLRQNRIVPQRHSDCVHELVRRTTAIQPERLAVHAWDGKLTYEELDSAAARLAIHLTEMGVGPETLVGICMDKSRWATAAMLAVLQAGAVVVPLGVQNPVTRIQQIMENAGATVILVDRLQEERLGGKQWHTVIVADVIADERISVAKRVRPTVTADNAAWVVFTSGSTGVPKGIVLEHGALCSSIQTHGPIFELGQQTRALQFSAHTFDMAITEIFTTLAFGGCVCIPSEHDRINSLEHYMDSMQVTFATLTSTVAGLLNPMAIPSLQTLALIGEPVKPAVVETWLGHTRILNAYGPAECSIHSSCSDPLTNKDDAPVIGYPLNDCLWITEPGNPNRLCPIGAPGELLIEGPILARGYLNDAAKTAKAFLVNPGFMQQLGLGTGRRVYRTGDLVRQNADGSITHLGRWDTQIKVRGQRVEIGEIEYHIAKHPSVQDVVVVMAQDGPWNGRLVSAVTLNQFVSGTGYGLQPEEIDKSDMPAALLQISELRHHLSLHVAPYMVPSFWIPVTTLPINASGKIDRVHVGKWISDSVQHRATETAESEADVSLQDLPASMIERQVQQVWSEVLNIPLHKITYQRSFISLGGDSMTAMQVVSACRNLGILVSVKDVLQCKAISELVVGAGTSEDTIGSRSEVPTEAFPLSPAQQTRMQDIASLTSIVTRLDQTVCLVLRQHMQLPEIARALEALVAKHAMLRARFVQSDHNIWTQRIEKQLVGSYHFRTANTESMRDLEKATRALQDLLNPINGPVFAVDHVNVAKQQVLIMAAHDLVVDQTSWEIIIHDLEELLSTRTLVKSRSLSYPVWLQLLTEYIGSQAQPPKLLPFDIPESDWTYWGLTPDQYLIADRAVAHLQLDEETTSLLHGIANYALRTEPVEILLAAVFQSFQLVFRDRSLPAVFYEHDGREAWDASLDLSDTVGRFSTMIPLHVSADPEDMTNTLRQTKDRRRQTSGRGLPYNAARFLCDEERLVYACRNPMEITFTYQEHPPKLRNQEDVSCTEAFEKLHLDQDLVPNGLDPEIRAQAMIDINASTIANRLEIRIGFSKQAKHLESIQRWIRKYGDIIPKLINGLVKHKPTATTSDFPLASLVDDDLVSIEKEYSLSQSSSSLADIEDIIPCTPVQQGILLSQLKSPGTYIMKQLFLIRTSDGEESVSTERLAEAWRQVVKRHSIMRTVFLQPFAGQSRFHQIVFKDPEVDIVFTSSEDGQNLESYVSHHPNVGLKGRTLPHRFIINTTAAGEIYGYFEISHALVDASSIDLLVDDLLMAYENTLPPGSGSSYTTYVSFLESKNAEDDIHYWTTVLDGAEPCLLALPPLKADVTVPSSAVRKATTRQLDQFHDIVAFCSTNEITTANVFQMAWALVLASQTSLTRTSFGYISGGRDAAIDNVHHVVGPMINMMVGHIQVDYSLTVVDAVKQVQQQFLAGFEHQKAPLQSIQHSLNLSGQSLFNTTLSYKRTPNPGQASSKSIVLQSIEGEDPTEYDLNVNVVAGDTEIEAGIQYCPLQISHTAANGLLDHLIDTVHTLCTNPDSILQDLILLPKKTIENVHKWSGQAPDADWICAHTLVQDATHAFPQAQAVCAWDGNMTYEELDQAATRLSYHLVSLGVGPEVMVGLCMDKSKWAIVSMLAILKAGGVVVPLGVQHPVARIESIIHDTASTIMLVDAYQAKRAGHLVQHLLTVDNALLSNLPVRIGVACETVTPDNAAWVIYTSGSTGTPKGVVLQHKAVSTSLQAHASAFGMNSSTRTIQFAAHTFDVALSEVFATLHKGGTICVPSEEQRMNNIMQAICTLNTNFTMLTSTVAKMLDPINIPCLKTIVLVGEAVDPAVVSTWLGHATILNAYGPSECSMHSSCSKAVTHRDNAAIIGFPLAGCFWVVDQLDHNRLIPIGSVGELLIEGPLLAREYLNDADKTTAAFVVDPDFVSKLGLGHGRRMYRTGDLVRQNEDGSLTYIGRRDTQIKIRGQRVETAEIEMSIVRLLPGVRAAVVDLVSSKAGDEQSLLSATIEFAKESQFLEQRQETEGLFAPSDMLQEAFAQLRESLLEVLPSYMVPSIYVPIVKLPLNVSGKMDRKAIRQLLESVDKDQLTAYVSKKATKLKPSTTTERQLQALWATALAKPVESIGSNDHFFQSGGDSVTAMRMVAAGRDAQISLTVSDIFSNPRLSDLASVLDAGGVDKQSSDEEDATPFSLWKEGTALDAVHRLKELADIAAQCGVATDQIEDIYPCTPLQEGLMAVTTQQPGTYVTQRLFRISETIVVTQFQAIWEKLVASLPILRTRIVPGLNSASLQVVVREPVNWLSSSSLQEYLVHDRSTPFQYGSHLSRVALIDEREHATGRSTRYFLWTMHHSIYDGWTIFKIEDMLARLSKGEMVPTLVPISRFVRHLSRHDTEQHRSFWQRYLDGVNKAKFPSLPDASYQPHATQTAQHHIAMQEQPGHVTSAMVLRGAWALLVAVYKGMDEAVFNVALSGRNAPILGVMDLVGPTVTTVPVRVRIQRDQTVHDFLASLQEQATDMIPFEHTGLQNIRRLVPQLGTDFDPGHLFTVQTIVEQAGQSSSLESIGLERQAVGGEGFHSYAFNISCTTDRENQAIQVEVQFDEAVISMTQVEALLHQFEHIYHQLSTVGQDEIDRTSRENNDRFIRQLSLVSKQDTTRLLDWNKDMPTSVQACVHSLILKSTARHPEAPAVCAWDGNMTYKELDSAATRLAHHLVSLGVGPEVMVGLCMDKSKWAIVSMLAILKAGGAVVPLGVQHPVARIEGIIKDTAAFVMLVDMQQAKRVGGLVQHPVIVDDSLLSSLPTRIGVACMTVTPDNAAWIVYTSGSTGTPKGVVLQHNALSTSLQAHSSALAIDTNTRTLQFAAYTFDVSIAEIFATLHKGGTICVLSEDQRMNSVAQGMCMMKVNFGILTSTVAGLLDPAEIPSLETIVLAGEAADPSVVDKWLPHATVLNAYGPSESSVLASCSRAITKRDQTAGIGFPLAGWFWVVDQLDHNRLVPIGSVGELLIEGPLLAREYLNDAEKTAAAFVVDPAFVSELGLGQGRRMYRTGDLVRQNEDGSLIYIGRRDTQIKIRGQRVETGEILYHITEHPSVQQSVVISPRQGPYNNRLVCFVALHDYISTTGYGPQMEEIDESKRAAAMRVILQIRDYLSEQVMEYMVPTVWIPLATLPINTSGKTDILQITRWIENTNLEATSVYTNLATHEQHSSLPATAQEQQLRAVWSQVLSIPESQISFTRSFLALGGDSITAMQVVAQCRAQGITLSVRDILQCKSISQLALKASITRSAFPDSAETSYEPFALAPIQQWFFDNVAPSSTMLRTYKEDRFNQSAVFRLQQHRSPAEIARAIETVVKKHAMLRARFHYDKTAGWRQSITKELLASYRFQTIEAKTDTEVFDIIRMSETTLDLERGPVFSADLIQNADRQLLFLTAHHLVVDLVSWRIILRDLEELLRRQTLSITQSLSFQAWCKLQVEYKYPIKVLPFDIPQADWDYWGLTPGSYVEADKISKVIEIDEQTTSLILGDYNRAMRTEPVEILLAALFHSFHSVFRDRDVPAIYNEGHGREPWDDAIDLSDTVGWFTTITPLHVPVDHDSAHHDSVGRDSFISTLRRTKDRRRQIPGRGLPYFTSRFLTKEGGAAFAHHNAMEILFNYQGQFQQFEKEDAILKVEVLDQLTKQERVAQIGANIKQAAVFDVGVSYFEGKMNIRFGYSRYIRNEDLVLQWLRSYQTLLGDLTSTLLDIDPCYTMSDFPLAALTERDLESLQKEQLVPAQLNFADVEDVYPCSPIQQGILISQIKSPSTYQIRQICHFRARDESSFLLDAARLAATWQHIIDRHAMLRTFFLDALPDQDVFHQVVLNSWKHEVQVIEVADENEIEALFGKHYKQEAFPPSQPPHRFSILRTSQGQLYGHFEVSHALIDASSINLLLEDLLLAYDYRLPASKGPCYSSYISYLQQNPVEEDLNYWTSLLVDTEPCHLPKSSAHTPSSNENSSPSESITAQITDLGALQKFRDTYGITLANIFQLSWAIVLANYTSLDNVCFGYLTNGRDVPVLDAGEMVGPMINMMVCTVSVKKDMTVLEAVKLVQERFFEGLDHQRTPLAAIQHSLHLSGQALFNTALSYKRQGKPINEHTSSIAIESKLAEDPTEYDVNVNVLGGDQDIWISLQYSLEQYSKAAASRLLGSLVQTVEALVTSGSSDHLVKVQSIWKDDVMSILKWNSQALDTDWMCVHNLVLESIARHPEAQAVCAWDGNMTYDELDRAATRLSHHLVGLGVGPEVMVGLCMDKSKWAIVSMLAILKAGGVVVPLGVQHPVARIKGIIHDTASTIMLVDVQQEERVGHLVQHPLIVDDSLLASLPDRTDRVCCKAVTPDNAAWVIYTSGSTGTPKGVVLQHKAVSTSLRAHASAFGMNSSTRTIQFAAHTFDVALSEVFATLHKGGTICVPSEKQRMDNVAQVMYKSSTNFTMLTSTVAKLLKPCDIPLLKTIVLVGEAVDPAVVSTWLGYATILNAYGPSECSMHSSCGAITNRDKAAVIGFPLAGCFWVVNQLDHNRLVPIGSVGELLIEGPLLAREYLNDAKKTAAAFVLDPAFVSELGLVQGRRMYRTGDLVIQNEDGSLTYIGRRDTQIKIRGQRVETGEILYHITEHPSVQQSVVVNPKQGPCNNRLVCLVVLHDSSSGTGYKQQQIEEIENSKRAAAMRVISQIRDYLSEQVMEYMVPTVWIPLATLPMNASGKTDLLQITRWTENRTPEAMSMYTNLTTDEQQDSRLPVTAQEQQLRAVWSQVLSIPESQISLNQSFLALGGDSITAMQVVAQCRGQGVTLSVRDVLQCKAISQLALKASITGNVILNSGEVSYKPFALAPIQQWFFDNVASSSTIPDGEDRFNQSAIFRLQQHRSASDVARAIETVVKKHAMLRARFHYDENDRWRQSITKELLGSYRFSIKEASTNKEILDIIRLSETTLDLERGPVFSADLIQNVDRQLLFLTAHHLIIDLVSWRIILRDLEELLQKQTLSITQSLSFQAWSQLQAKQAALYRHPTEVLPFDIPQADWDYWGLTPGSYIEADKICKVIEIDEQTTSLILGDCNRAMRTEPVEILLAALFHSFHSIFRDRDVPAIYNEGHGREPWDDAIDLSDTVGWFTTITPLHAPVDRDSAINTLRRTKDRRRQIPGRGLPYFTSRFLTKEGGAAFAHHNAMEILFNYQGQFQQFEKEDAILTVEAILDELRGQDQVSQIGANIKQAAVFDVGVSYFEGKMNIRFGYSRHIRNEDLVLQWLRSYQTLLGDLTSKLLDMDPCYTTSDFPLAALTERDLQSLQKEQMLQAQLSCVGIEDVYPCSPIQQGILISQIKSPSTYQVRQICHFQARDDSSSLDAARLAATWQQIIDRHAILRTFFVDSLPDQELFHQVVLESWKSEVRVIDVSDENEVDARQYYRREAFPPGQPPHRFTILRTLGGQLYGHFEVSHALIDASSINLLLKDLLLAYDCRLPASKSPCYSSYITYLQQNPIEEDLDYWTSLLAATEPCHLPKSSAHTPSSNEGRPSADITAQITDLRALHQFRDNYGITLANIFQLSWAIVLANYTSLDEVCFGYLTNGRDVPIPGASEMVGPMINMMVCAVSVKKDMTVLEAVKLVQERFFEGLDHQRTPLAAIQHSLHLSGQALFNTALSYKREVKADEEQTSSSIAVECRLAEDPTEYDVNVNVLGGDEAISISLQYLPDHYSKAAASRLLGSLVQTVEALVTSRSSDHLAKVQSIWKDDVESMLKWNSRGPNADLMCVHTLIQDATQTCLQAEAVCAWDGNMTYEELDRAATRLSYHLVSLGVGPEVMVGLCMDKSKLAIVSMLAILKAGGVVVPLGVQHPIARIEGIINDTAASVMLVDMQQAKRVGGLVQHSIIVDKALLSSLPVRTGVACETVTPDNAAWVIYTSGSTGTPKGVVLQHKALSTSLRAHASTFGMDSNTRTIQFAAHTFDATISEVFATFYKGGAVCVPSEDQRMNDIAQVMHLSKTNFTMLTSTVAKLLKPCDIPSLKTIILVGEAVDPAVVSTWLGHATVLNAYGPSECSIHSSCSKPITHRDQAPVIGFPIAGCFWVVNQLDYNRLIPIGAIGELLIEGPLLAREYLNDTKKSAAAFVVDPTFVGELGLGQGRRMYRTGDLVRQNEDGSLTYIGRRDTQIKLRGQRVETGEVESYITRLMSGVRAAVVDLIPSRTESGQAALMVAIEFDTLSDYDMLEE